MPYFKDISVAYKTLKEGLKLTFSHLKDATQSREPLGVEEDNYFDQQNGLFTTQYPFESIPVPDNGRYRLDNEIDDCIVCDKCAKICPVNCIDIEPIRSAEEIGKTSDGTSKRLYAAKFDIDMAKCCFCGLCTTVCPTECLTMTKAYDFSEFDIKLHNYAFGNMSEDEVTLRKKEEAEEQERREAAKAAKQAQVSDQTASAEQQASKPKFVPRVKPKTSTASNEVKPAAKPKFKPKVKPKISDESPGDQESSVAEEKPKAKPKFRPKVKPKASAEAEVEKEEKPKPKFRPKIKPKIQSKASDDDIKKEKKQEDSEQKPKFKPRPIIKKKKE